MGAQRVRGPTLKNVHHYVDHHTRIASSRFVSSRRALLSLCLLKRRGTSYGIIRTGKKVSRILEAASVPLDEPGICADNGVQECHAAPIRRWHRPTPDVPQRMELAIQRYVEQASAHGCIHRHEPAFAIGSPYQTSQIGNAGQDYFTLTWLIRLRLQRHHADARVA